MAASELTNERMNQEVRKVAGDVVKLLQERGGTYGPDILQQMGFEYPVVLIIAKALRLKWFWTKHRRPHWDSLRDLLGYAILALALAKINGDPMDDTVAVSPEPSPEKQ